MLDLGTFEVKSGMVIVSDPCYDRGTCMLENLPAKNGKWKVKLVKSDEGDWGIRCSELIAYCEDEFTDHFVKGHGFEIFHHFGDIGVDSGQAGIYDAKHFKDDSVITETYKNEFDGLWYTANCNITLEKPNYAGVIPFGCVSSSGYGDGSYEVRGVKNKEGEVTMLRIGFILDKAEEA